MHEHDKCRNRTKNLNLTGEKNLSHPYGPAIWCSLENSDRVIATYDSPDQELRVFSWSFMKLYGSNVILSPFTKAAATVVMCIVGNLALNLILASHPPWRHVMNQRRYCFSTSINLKHSRYVSYKHCWTWVGNSVCFGYELCAFVWLVWFYVFCEMISAFVL